ncbi:MAG: hypothetical protein K5925_01915 [Bacilli bacterium]|nr:hypothetical protein [Bacilli bacterium]
MIIEDINEKGIKLNRFINEDGFEFVFSPIGASIYYIKDGETYLNRFPKNFKDFLRPKCYYGKTVGRVANRIRGNKIRFNEQEFEIENNEGENTLHGGIHVLSVAEFKFKSSINSTHYILTYTYLSKDGESGFPGNLNVEVKYLVPLHGFDIEIIYTAWSDKDTPIGLANHAYFTLGSKSLDELTLRIDSDYFLNVDKDMLADKISEMNFYMDFRKPKVITKDIDHPGINHDRLRGYDNFYYFINKDIEKCNVSLENEYYKMDIYTDFEGCQIYTSNFEEPFPLAPECKQLRDSIAIEPSDSHLRLRILKAGHKYIRHMKYVFTKKVKKEKQVMDNNIIKKEFAKLYGHECDNLFSCGGRFEILGNHTDHNHGLCLAATCDLNITAAVKKTDGLKTVQFISKGYDHDLVRLTILEPLEEEKGSSKAIIRGVAEYLNSHGYKIGGFEAYSESSIFPGAGVSSSAAFELLVGQIFNDLYNEGKISKLELCKAGQYAENRYFGKASGLLDQIGVGYGNISYIDFKDIKNPNIEQVPFVFDDLSFLIVNTGGSHAHLSHLYSQIPQDMYSAAQKSGVEFLRDISFDDLDKSNLSDIEYSRALHFYSENERVQKAVEAIKNHDKETFLQMINESRLSSTNNLRNMMVENEYKGSPLEACDYFLKVTEGKGAIKINGGGFAGSVIAVVPKDILPHVIEKMAEKYGKENVREVFVRTSGPSIL